MLPPKKTTVIRTTTSVAVKMVWCAGVDVLRMASAKAMAPRRPDHAITAPFANPKRPTHRSGGDRLDRPPEIGRLATTDDHASGGKDSTAIALRLKEEFNLNPLLVTFSPLLPNEVGNHNRTLSAVIASLTFTVLPSFFIRPNLRVDSGASFRETTTDLYVQTKVPVLGSIRGRMGNGFRLPTFNDLFWPTGSYAEGNPNLKSEQSNYFSFSMEVFSWFRIYWLGRGVTRARIRIF